MKEKCLNVKAVSFKRTGHFLFIYTRGVRKYAAKAACSGVADRGGKRTYVWLEKLFKKENGGRI